MGITQGRRATYLKTPIGLGVAFVVLLVLALRPCRFSIDESHLLVGPDVPVYYMIFEGARLEEIQAALEDDPDLVNGFASQGKSLLCFAAQVRRRDVVKLLLDMGAHADGCGTEGADSPLACAIAAEDTAIARILLDHGASAFQPVGPFAVSPYEMGIASDCAQIVDLMREAKKKANAQPHDRGYRGSGR